MKSSSRNSNLMVWFILSFLLTLTLYILRGLGIVTFFPGGVILFLIALSMVTGLLYFIDKTKRV